MEDTQMLDMLKAGVHFGHKVGRWHPKMRPYIFGSRGGISIIDLEKTQKLLEAATAFAEAVARRGGTILFVGSKRQAKAVVREHAERVHQPYVVERWIGGTFTNFETVGRLIQKYRTQKEGLASGAYAQYTKKERLRMEKDVAKLETIVGGIASLDGLPSAVYVVDAKEEKIAVREAKKVGVPLIALVDTNVNPEGIAHPIPANDDAVKSIMFFTSRIADAIARGTEAREIEQAQERAALAEAAEVALAAPAAES